ncbi:GNAT family N-acetyltransferase [Microbacterium maritypicum]|uniref:GNAT family N-acetyltransferase n=1 Tax=Microbacterium maritypicum TaxID=33918 RepID=UPI003A8FAAED
MDNSQEAMVTLRGTDQVLRELSTSGSADSLVDLTNITKNEDVSVYELHIEDHTVAGLLYTEAGNRVTLLATSVFPEFRGKGLAGKLLRGVLDMLRTEGRTVTLTCPFATAFVHSHPEYADVVDPSFPGNAHSRRHGRH